eukprot:CAMPEP_0179338540 /NCGR_PEP_ID=MMETSP0797-20121207/68234_1 /TAXON_ID=47934 /ORGANISM="Dinophysis acuminata, Strain DAEP01" /LENGTH=48 /DNA_ID= /DNA_START= /DNA_END= /DNA_ORIENTATION=
MKWPGSWKTATGHSGGRGRAAAGGREREGQREKIHVHPRFRVDARLHA